jgi:hypothetical protein
MAFHRAGTDYPNEIEKKWHFIGQARIRTSRGLKGLKD